jgi:hypothetical protein
MQMPDIMCAGVAIFDADGDGDFDLYIANRTWAFGRSEESSAPTNLLLLRGEDGRYRDATASSGVAQRAYGGGVAVGDYDNDGDPDLYLANFGPDVLLRNRGDGTFEEVTRAAGVDVPGWSSSVAFFDYDLDGFLDIYVARYVDYDPEKKCMDAAGRPDFCGPKEFPPVPDVLLHNEGDGTFTDVSARAGIEASVGAGLGVVCEDFDDDGLPDVYVANDAYPNHLWINRGDGTFSDEALLLGCALNEQGMAEAGMGVVAADLDGDADLDLFMTHLKHESHTLYENLGGGIGFQDVTALFGLSGPSLPFTGFGTFALDLELDGDLDLLVANGAVNRSDPFPEVHLPSPWDHYAEPNQIFLNEGPGRFRPLGEEAGPFGSDIEVTRGLAAADLDGDGDLDVLVGNCYGPARLYRNDAPRRGHWLLVRAVDPGLSRDAIGAHVAVHAGGRTFLRRITRSLSYQSSSPPEAHFGLGEAARFDSITVRWPGGGGERFPGGTADRRLELARGRGRRIP